MASFRKIFTTTLALGALFLLLGGQSLFAQSGHANIGGTVTDSQGAVVSGATVTATNIATGVATPATTNGSGVFLISQVVPGVYNIKVEKEGFGAQQQDNVTLAAEQNYGANFTLQPGKVSEKVTVEAGSELVHTETAELSQTINEKTIDELPLNGRNPASLVLLAPGTVDLITYVSGQGPQTYTTFPTETNASTNGGGRGSTLYLLDGAFNMDSYQLAAAPFPNPDATQEFTVIGNNFDARYGFTPGGVVSIVTKSGTNNWHGDAFDYLRNGGFNAKDYFTHATDQIHRNQFGGSLGGPIIKDKLFAFGNYQGTRSSIFNTLGNAHMWTPAELNNGDFSAYCGDGSGATQFDSAGICLDRHLGVDPRNPSGPQIPYVDHQIYLPNPVGYRQTGVPLYLLQGGQAPYYAGNQIPISSYSPGAVALAKAVQGNLQTTDKYGAIPGVGYPTLNNFNEYTVRVDYNLNDHNRISGRSFDNFFSQPAYSGGNAVASNRSWIVDWQSYAGTWTWTISPHMVNNLTPSYTRMYDSSNSGLTKLNGGKGICYSQFINVADQATPDCTIEDLTVNGGYQSTGGFPINNQNFNGVNRSTWGFSDNLSISKGKHLIVAGVDVLHQYWYLSTDWASLPLIEFDGGPNGLFTGQGYSDFFLGAESYMHQDGGVNEVVRQYEIAPYLADQIKVKPNLTVSLGLRYEPFLAPQAQGGHIATFIPGEQSVRYPGSPVGLVFPGDPGVPAAGVASNYKRFFDPRVGIAWAPKALPNTSIRAAFGMYATPIDYGSWNHASEMVPWSPAFDWSSSTNIGGNAIGIIPFDNPWSVYTPTGGKQPFPPFNLPSVSPPSNFNFAPFLPASVPTAFSPRYQDGRTYTWNTSLEHQFGAHWLAKAAYVASESDHQSFQNNANPGLPICGPVSETCAQVTSNAFTYSNFTGVDMYYSDGTSSYQSGQFTLEKRFNHGLQFTANYTYSHTIDIAFGGTGINGGSLLNPGCVRCNRANSDVDVPQVFVMNFVYQTPVLAGWNRATKLALGGWQLSGIYRAQSGLPFFISCGCTTSWQLAGSDSAQYASGVTHVHTFPSRPNQGTLKPLAGGLTGYLTQSDFNPLGPPQGSAGNSGRNPPGAYGPGTNTWDLGASKTFKITERYGFQFRWEMFNAFNRTALGQPYNNQGSPYLGLIYYTQTPARVMQAAGKFTF